MRPLDSIDIHNPDTVLEHDKKCCVGMSDMHAADPVANIFDVACTYFRAHTILKYAKPGKN